METEEAGGNLDVKDEQKEGFHYLDLTIETLIFFIIIFCIPNLSCISVFLESF